MLQMWLAESVRAAHVSKRAVSIGFACRDSANLSNRCDLHLQRFPHPVDLLMDGAKFHDDAEGQGWMRGEQRDGFVLVLDREDDDATERLLGLGEWAVRDDDPSVLDAERFGRLRAL